MENNHKKTKILIATGVYPPDLGGPATYSKSLYDRLPAKGYQVEIVSFGWVRNYPQFLRHVIYGWRLIKVGRSCDLIFAQDAVSVGLPALMVSAILRIKFIVRLGGDYAWERARQKLGVTDNLDVFQATKYGWIVEIFRFLQRWVLRNADFIIVPSNYFGNIVKKWGIASEKIKVIPNGVETGTLKQGLNYDDKKRIIISAGRLIDLKGFSALIDVLRFPELSDWVLEVVGDGPDRQKLQSKIDQLGLGGRVKLLGSLPKEKLIDRLQQSRIFVLNSQSETFSFQTVEAMRCRVPVVVTGGGNLADLVTPMEEGMRINFNDTAEIFKSIMIIDSNKELREKLINKAYHKSQSFNIDNMIEQTHLVLSSMVQN